MVLMVAIIIAGIGAGLFSLGGLASNHPVSSTSTGAGSLTVTHTVVDTSTVILTDSTSTTSSAAGSSQGQQTTTATTTQTVTTTHTETATQQQTTTETVTDGNLVDFSIDSLVLNATTDSWTMTMTNYSGENWNIQATLTATSGSGGSATIDSLVNFQAFQPGVDSQTVGAVGPQHLQAGDNYCVSIDSMETGSTVPSGSWSWESCFVQAVS